MLILIKPHAITFVPHFKDVVLRHLRNQNITGINFTVKCTAEIIDKHYAAISEYAMNDLADLMFWGMPVMSYKQYKEKYPEKTALEICKDWRSNTAFKMKPGCFLSRMSGGEIVANGFYGFVREDFIGQQVHVFIANFEPGNMEYLRKTVIGTDTTKSGYRFSIRGAFEKEFEDVIYDPSMNAVHASDSREEFDREVKVWLTAGVENVETFF